MPPFDLPDLQNLPDLASLIRYEAIGLFVERATAVRPDFALTKYNSRSVAEITVRLDGLPLALELAASRVKVLPPQAILERLGGDLPLLTSRVSDAPARQRTLRGTIEWSYELLREDERRLFEQLSVRQMPRAPTAVSSEHSPPRRAWTRGCRSCELRFDCAV